MGMSTPSLLRDRTGFRLNGEEHTGFVDLVDLPPRDRRKIAVWALRYAPDAATDEQRALANSTPPPPGQPQRLRDAQRSRDFLDTPIGRRLWDLLGPETRARLRDPQPHVGGSYPLRTSQLATLIGITDRQVGHWSRRGILPFHLDGRAQRYSVGAAVIGTFLASLDQQERKTMAALVRDPSRLEPLQLVTLALVDTQVHDLGYERAFVDVVGHMPYRQHESSATRR